MKDKIFDMADEIGLIAEQIDDISVLVNDIETDFINRLSADDVTKDDIMYLVYSSSHYGTYCRIILEYLRNISERMNKAGAELETIWRKIA